MKKMFDFARSVVARGAQNLKEAAGSNFEDVKKRLLKAIDITKRSPVISLHEVGNYLNQADFEGVSCRAHKNKLAVAYFEKGKQRVLTFSDPKVFHSMGGPKEIRAQVQHENATITEATKVFEIISCIVAQKAWGEFLGLTLSAHDAPIAEHERGELRCDLSAIRKIARLPGTEKMMVDALMLTQISFDGDGIVLKTELPLSLIR